MSYKSTRRHWVKLWVGEWLDGTTRFELTPEQRLLWIDLLALAGRSRFPGMIYPGVGEGEKKIGYPLSYLAGVLSFQPDGLRNALDILSRHGHITITESATDCLIIGIVNWDKYQSEYQRQKGSRKEVTPKVRKETRQGAQEVTPKNTMKLPVEGEVEVEGDGEGERETSGAFSQFFSEYPRQEKKLRAKYAWFKSDLEGRASEVMASLMDWKRSEQWKDPKFIPYAVNWLTDGLWKQSPYVAARKESLHEQLEKLGIKP